MYLVSISQNSKTGCFPNLIYKCNITNINLNKAHLKTDFYPLYSLLL